LKTIKSKLNNIKIIGSLINIIFKIITEKISNNNICTIFLELIIKAYNIVFLIFDSTTPVINNNTSINPNRIIAKIKNRYLESDSLKIITPNVFKVKNKINMKGAVKNRPFLKLSLKFCKKNRNLHFYLFQLTVL